MASHPPVDLGALPIVDRSPQSASGSRQFRTVLIGAVAGALILAVGLPQLGLWGNPGCGLPINTCTRVLFIGDSYTYVNDLPTTFADLAWSAGYRVDAVTLANGGESLAEDLGIPLLGQLAFVPAIRKGGDTGRPVAATEPTSEIGQAFAALAAKIDAQGPARVYRQELRLA